VSEKSTQTNGQLPHQLPLNRNTRKCHTPCLPSSLTSLHLSIFPIPHPLNPLTTTSPPPPPPHNSNPHPHPHPPYITTPTATPKNKKTNIKNFLLGRHLASAEEVFSAAPRPEGFRRIYMGVFLEKSG